MHLPMQAPVDSLMIGIPLLDAVFCYQAMQKAAALHMPISLHEEDKAFITNNGINAGKTAENLMSLVLLPSQKKLW